MQTTIITYIYRHSHWRVAIINIIAAAALVLSCPSVRAQADSGSDSSITLPLVQPSGVPPSGTFWLYSMFGQISSNDFGVPIPCNPWGTNVNVYVFTNEFLGDIQYVIDDRPIVEAEAASTMLRGGFAMAESDESGDSDTPASPSSASFPSNSLWLEITAITNATVPYNGIVYLTVHGTVANQTYEILSRTALTNTGWTPEGMIVGVAGQDWTATTVSVGARTNTLFLWARSYVDTDGDGLPDWWELQNGLDPNSSDTGNTGVPDAYKDDGAGDGWTMLYKYEHGISAHQYITPPPPKNVRARVDVTGTNVVLTWESPGVAVAGYGIETWDPYFGVSEITVVPSSNYTYTVSLSYPAIGFPISLEQYRIRAYFGNGTYTESASVSPARADLTPEIAVVRGSQAHPMLAIKALPPEIVKFRVVSFANWWNDNNAWVEMYPSNFVNGVAPVPASQMDGFWGDLLVQGVAADGSFGDVVDIWANLPEYIAEGYSVDFVSAAPFMKENLKFLLRSATVSNSFSYGGDPSYTLTPEQEYSRFARSATPGNYEYYGFHQFSSNLNSAFVDEVGAFYENYLWQNFVYQPTNFDDSDMPTNGPWYFDSDGFRSLGGYYGPASRLTTPPSTSTPLRFISTNSIWLSAQWVPPTNAFDPALAAGVGVWTNSTGAYLQTGVRNRYGLGIESLILAAEFNNPVLLTAGGPTGGWHYYNAYGFMQTEEPVLQIQDYYFASQTPYFNYIIEPYEYNSTNPAPPLPGSPTFSVTNASPVLIAPFGQTFVVSGWAKMAILNGYTNKFAYLEQYFDKAYKMTNGTVTTTETGVLSPYGEFFPTEPGPTALVTKPDIDTGETNHAVVNVIKLQLDVNHDGTMDLSFAGPDNTSQSRPFVFWINNDSDVPGVLFEGVGEDQHPPFVPDYKTYTINSQRDLEDFARIWICGLPVLPANSGYQVSLSWTNVTSGSPAINLADTVETNGGIGYITNSDIAAAMLQRGPGKLLPVTYFPSISTTNTFVLPSNLFTNGGNKCFLFEGAGLGSGELLLTISKGTNIIAQTGAWMELHDVRDLYERMIVTNNFTGAISNWTSNAGRVESSMSSGLGDDKEIIVFVHGINVSEDDWLIDSDTVFKRLYWAGFHGKFAAVKWPCNYLTPFPAPFTTAVFNQSEAKAYKSSTAFTTYINDLHTRFPDHHLRLLVHSQGNAMVSEAISQANIAFDTYILTQAALPNSAYDINAATNTDLFNKEFAGNYTPEWQPMGYHGAYTNLPGRLVNFYNPLDKVLGYWITDQKDLKPSLFLDSSHYEYDGVNSHFVPVTGTGYVVIDSEESRAMVARSRTDPIGRSGPASSHGVISSAVNLNTQFGFDGSSDDEHSAQWTRPIQTSLPYFLQILQSISP